MKKMNRRVVSFLLALAMFVSLIPSSVFTIFASDAQSNTNEQANQEEAKNEFEANVGKQAIFDIGGSDFIVANESYIEKDTTGSFDYFNYEPVFDDLLVVMIKDYFYNDQTGEHWYKIGARDGETLQYDLLNELPWVYYISDDELAEGYDPYLVMYNENDTIKLVTAEYDLGEDVDPLTVLFVVAGPASLSAAEIDIEERTDSNYPISSLAYTETTYETSWNRAIDINITKANGEKWASTDGDVSILYAYNQFGTDTFAVDVECGGAFLYVDGTMFSAAPTDRWGYELSDIVYTNSGNSTLVFEHMPESFAWVADTGYFTSDAVTLYDNNFNAKEYLAANLPVTFTAGYVFTHNDEEYYWLESDELIGSPYFLVKAEDVTLGELPEEFGDGRVSITDKDGNAINAITLPQYEKPAYSAVSSLSEQTADVSYQWQIEYEAGKWVDILGEDEATVKLSYGIVATLLDENGQVNLRCESKCGSQTAYSAPIPVTVEMFDEEAAEIDLEDADNSGTSTIFSAPYDIAPAAEGDAGEVPQSYTVIIQYLFENGKQAYAPWTATITAGQTINQTVKSPDVVGYKPKAGEEEIKLNQVVNGNVYVTVTYVPIKVKVTVEHRFQPVNGSSNTDDYMLFDEVEMQLLTGSAVGAGLELTGEDLPAGFYALKYDTTTTVAANGTTVIAIYYDRYYYLMNFDLDGGYGAEPIYAPVGTPLTGLIKTPTKAGYTFNGWKAADDTVYPVANFPYSAMPANNTEFVAQWTAGNTTFDVVFWYENADDDGYTQAGSSLDIGATAGQTVNGATYKDTNFTGKDANHFTYSHADTNVVVKGDGSTVVNVYFKRNVYTMTFVMGSWANSCDVEIHQHENSCNTLVCEIEEHSHQANCFNCGQLEGTHTRTCYQVTGGATIAANTTSATDDYLQEATLNENGLYHYDSWYSDNYDRYYIKIGNYFYRVNNATSNTKVTLKDNCGHHIHDSSCWKCTQAEHTHTDNCYVLSCGKYEHYHSGSTCYLVVEAKYDADIKAVWDTDPVKTVGNNGFVFQSSITGDYYTFLEKMPGSNITMTKSTLGSVKRTVYYCVEVIPGVEYPAGTTRQHTKNGVTRTYYIYDTIVLTVSSSTSLTYDEDYFPITGFTQLYTKNEDWGKSLQSGSAYLYYTRDTHTLTFSNYGTIVSGKGGDFVYQADISGQYFVPDYPATLEPGAYVFEGWYQSPFFGDTKFNFTSTDEDGNTVKATMPAHDLTLYARWVPKEHTVKLYLTDDKTQQIGQTQTVDHRDTAVKPEDPKNGVYTFVGWFYMDGTTEKAFDFSMPVTQDLELYAKWSSNVLVDYTVYYKLADGTVIAPSTTGQALAGTSKTFEAKYGEELNEGFRTRYYPTTQSSCVIKMRADGENVYTFIYESQPSVTYTVKYLEQGTNKPLLDAKVVSTTSAIVTENFEYIKGYMPDAYSKTKVVTADGLTEIIFYYTKDEVHAPVRVVHMTQNAVGNGYTIYQEFTDLNGVINQSYTATILNIEGFDFARATAAGAAVTPSGSNVTGTVSQNGLEIIIYYDREVYDYEFQFREQGTEKELADAVTGEDRYGAQIGQNALVIPGYSCVSGNVQTITIQIDVDGGTKNIKIFYYVEKKVDIYYQAIGPAGAGYVTPQQEVQVPAKTGTVSGSVVTINPGYKFIGWFYDEQCTRPVTGDGWLNGTTIIPQKNSDGLYESATYYAKFDYDLTSLTIVKDGADAYKDIDPNQTFIFDIYDGDTLVTTVTVHAGTNWKVIVDGLTVGKTYRIVERTDWSWRYQYNGVDVTNCEIEEQETRGVIIKLGLDGKITFTNSRGQDQWLDGDAWCDNIFNQN
ncbi:MAG: hypothetical protein E7438_00730 [Ruminococcaceae bacterium]|nr:hypothetical protein [Oscillospiraceae bacterium]